MGWIFSVQIQVLHSKLSFTRKNDNIKPSYLLQYILVCFYPLHVLFAISPYSLVCSLVRKVACCWIVVCSTILCQFAVLWWCWFTLDLSRDQLLKLVGNCPPVSPNTVFCPKRDVSIDVGIKGGVGGQISRLLIRVYNINCNDIFYRFRMEIDVAYLKSQDWPSTSITARWTAL